mmetsp:Transcript_2494/g.9147  ORF Transcript_2494/g.9147 Transcript_2494/m.9147 type:complete len:487 (-) Transcript_2494:1233-2693(-)
MALDAFAEIFLDDERDVADRRRKQSAASSSTTFAGVDETVARRGTDAETGRSAATTPSMMTAKTMPMASPPPGMTTPRARRVARRPTAEENVNSVSDWFASLWRSLIAEDGDEWEDTRRGRGGTPSGARDLHNIDLGVEQEMELVLKTPESGGRLSSARLSSGGDSGYFFGDDAEEDKDDATPTSSFIAPSIERQSSLNLPAVFPGQHVEVVGEAKVCERAAELQRLWGDPSVFANADDCRSIIRSLREAEVVTRLLDQRLARWALRMKIYGEDGEPLTKDETAEFWRARARDLCEIFLDALLKIGGRFESCATTPRHREALVNVVEGYVMGGLQTKLLNNGVSVLYAEEDAFTLQRFERIKVLPIEALGLDASSENALSASLIASVATIPTLSCPTHMASRVAEIARNAGAAATSADDLLIVFVVLIARASLSQAFSLVKYIETFHALISNAHKGEQGFSLANFSGAVHYARGEHMEALLVKHEA